MVQEKYFEFWRIYAGIAVFPYQLAFGISLRWLRCSPSLMFRLYFLMFKVWINFSCKKNYKKQTSLNDEKHGVMTGLMGISLDRIEDLPGISTGKHWSGLILDDKVDKED